MVVIPVPVDENIEKELDSYNDRFEELKAKMSELRKQGKDTFIAELFALDFAPRVKMARVTYEDKDIEKVKGLLRDIDKELKESESGSDFDHMLGLISEAYQDIRDGDMKKASEAYSSIIAIYKTLPADMKKATYVACLDIKKKIDKIL